MSIEAFLDQYKQENWYVVSILPNAMKQDVKVGFISCFVFYGDTKKTS